MKILFLQFIITLFVFANADHLEVTVKQGTLRGKEALSPNGGAYISFTGIPYAKPPINQLRFQPSVALSGWKGVLDATKSHAKCLQMHFQNKNYTIIGDEDCLYLNVFTPNTEPPEKLPVMVFIHGGEFVTGSASDFDPSLIMDRDVVLVTINYRLGPFGFMSTSTYHLLGNDGLKDQALAIKWVKNNIVAFGGNPDKITLFGQDAGGISVHLHMVSPLTRDLINGVIAQSGTAVAHNALMPAFASDRMTKFLAQRLNCIVDDNGDNMMYCFMYKSGKKILEKAAELKEWEMGPATVFKPIMEPDLPNAFLTSDPADIITSGKAANVPFMTGITSDEGDLRTALLFKDSGMIDMFNEKQDLIIPSLLNYRNFAIHKNVKPATESIKQFYLKNKKLSNKTKSAFSKMFGDGLYLYAANFAIDLHLTTSKQPLYYYVFGYKGYSSYCNLVDQENKHGVCHSDDLLYLFNDEFNFPNQERNDDEEEVVELMIKLWTNFAKYGNPTPQDSSKNLPHWKTFTSDEPNYYYIQGAKNIENLSEVFKDRTQFWKNLELNNKRGKRQRDEL